MRCTDASAASATAAEQPLYSVRLVFTYQFTTWRIEILLLHSARITTPRTFTTRDNTLTDCLADGQNCSPCRYHIIIAHTHSRCASACMCAYRPIECRNHFDLRFHSRHRILSLPLSRDPHCNLLLLLRLLIDSSRVLRVARF